MSMATVPYVISADLHSAQLFRQTLQALLSGTGVVGTTDLAVTHTTPEEMKVAIAAGYVFMPGTQGNVVEAGARANAGSQHVTYSSMPADFTTQGVYLGWNSGTELALSASNGTNPRIDLIVASVQDAQYSGSFNQTLLQVVTGTPAGSPVPPTPPENTVVLAQVEVKAKVTKIEAANITDERQHAAPSVAVGQTYTSQTGRSAGVEYEPSPSRAALVIVEASNVSAVTKVEKIEVGGVAIAGGAAAEVGGASALTFTFVCPAGKKWKAVGLTGAMVSSYLLL